MAIVPTYIEKRAHNRSEAVSYANTGEFLQRERIRLTRRKWSVTIQFYTPDQGSTWNWA